MIFYTSSNKKYQQNKVKKTKNKIIIVKHSKNKQQKNNYFDDSIIYSNNNDTFIRKFKGMNEYKLVEYLRHKFKQNISIDYIRKIWNENKEVSLKYNENGKLKCNTEKYKEVM